MSIDENALRFLRSLARWQGVASPSELGTHDNQVRQLCKRRGLVTYDDGYWRITEAGRAAVNE